MCELTLECVNVNVSANYAPFVSNCQSNSQILEWYNNIIQEHMHTALVFEFTLLIPPERNQVNFTNLLFIGFKDY